MVADELRGMINECVLKQYNTEREDIYLVHTCLVAYSPHLRVIFRGSNFWAIELKRNLEQCSSFTRFDEEQLCYTNFTSLGLHNINI